MKVAIIGAGAAGLMCAYHVAKNGNDTFLFDKNAKVGRKIYITGKGRCNLTNNCSRDEFFQNIVTNPKFLYSSYSAFNCQDTMDFFENNGLRLVTERGNRVFPSSMKSSDVIDTLYRLNINIGVTLKLNETVKKIYNNCGVFNIETDKKTYIFDKVVIATGGMSYPLTGSTGDGYDFAKKMGHSIIRLVPGLCALKVKEKFDNRMIGFTQKNVRVTAKTPFSKIGDFGDITFYKEGLSGPISLTLSSQLNKVEPSKIELEIDFKPALDDFKLDQRILREISSPKNKTLEDVIHKLLPSELVNFYFETSKIDKRTLVNNLRREIREKIVYSLKHFKLTFVGLDNINNAIITSGGVNIKEINPKTMESTIMSGLYFAGEILDVDAYTGGFNLQIAFMTGYLAAKAIG